MLDYSKIKELLGIFDKKLNSQGKIILKFTINFPTLSVKESIGIFKTTFDNYKSKEDFIEDQTTWINKKYRGRNMADIMENPSDPKENLFSTYIFRNLYTLIQDSDLFDENLKKRSFLSGMQKIKQGITEKLKKNYRDQILLDKFEIICEFIDLIEDKVKKLNDQK